MSKEDGVAPKEAPSNFERTTERIVERTEGDRVHPREDISRDNNGKTVGAREAHDKGVKDSQTK